MSDRSVCLRPTCDAAAEVDGRCHRHHEAMMRKRTHKQDRSKAKDEVPCTVCGRLVLKYRGDINRGRRPFCSWECRADDQFGVGRRGNASTDLVVVTAAYSVESCRVPDGHPARRQQPRPRLFIDAPCAWCKARFTILAQVSALYCSKRCLKDAAKAKRGKFKAPHSVRLAVYERDGWVCQLCFDPVDRTLPWTDDWAASLDHIECQAWVLVPDHSPKNLRLAHRWCNAVRGDESYYTAADLLAV